MYSNTTFRRYYLYFHKGLEDVQRTAKGGHLSALTLDGSGPGVGLGHRRNLIFLLYIICIVQNFYSAYGKSLGLTVIQI